MRWYANNALTSVAVLFLGGLAFALAVHHLLREQTAVRLRQIEQARAEHPGVKVVVHPECPMPVVDAADAAGSTDLIRKYVAASQPGDVIAIGTEVNLVNRLAAEHPDRTIFCLDPVVCPCSTMYRIHPGYLAWVLDGLLEGEVRNEIVVPDDVARDAKVALERMLAARPKDASPVAVSGRGA